MALPIIGLTSLLGYYLNKDETPKINKTDQLISSQNIKNNPHPFETPNGKNIYSSDYVNEAETQILNKSKELYKQAETPALTGVIPPLFNTYGASGSSDFFKIEDLYGKKLSDIDTLSRLVNVNKQQEPSLDTRPMFNSDIKYKGEEVPQNFSAFEQPSVSDDVSLLTGKPLEKTHSNMVPFFGSNIKQNVEKFTNETILDLHSGNTSTFKHKNEVGQFFQNQEQDIYGTPIFTTNIENDRFIPSVYKQGEKPFQDEKISAPISGTFENKILPSYKDVNDLRPGNKPKESYDARTLSGQMGEVRGVQSNVNKNRPDTFYEQGSDRLIVTTGQFIEKKADEDFITNFKSTGRNDYNMEYYGPMGSAEFATTKQRIHTIDNSNQLNFDSLAQIPKRQNFENDYIRNVSADEKRVNDYGKVGVIAFETERSTTSDKTHLLNPISATRGIKTSFSDIAKSTTKETTLDNDSSRNLRSNFDKGLIESYYTGVADFNAKTTNKETIKEDNYKGITNKENGMGYLVNKYDARTTGKEMISNISEYQGNAGYTNNPTSHENYLNAEIRANKEETLERDRSAGPQNFQISASKNIFGDIQFTKNMELKESIDNREKLNVLMPNIFPSKMSMGVSDRIKYDEDVEDTVFVDRIQSDIVSSQLGKNPFSMYRERT